MDTDLRVKQTVYEHFATTGQRPTPEAVGARTDLDRGAVLATYQRLRALRVLVLEEDGAAIRMAPPFSGIPTQHEVRSGGVRYFANCAWDALGIPAALKRAATVHSRCEESGAPLTLEIGPDGPAPNDWLFHSLLPAARWWDNIVFT